MEIICTSDEYDKTVEKLRLAEVPFKEVVFVSASWRKPAIRIEEEVFIKVLVGTLVRMN